MTDYNTIAESNNFIVLDQYSKRSKVNDSLPREIALCQKQYEYYRDLLLTFPKAKEVEANLNTVEKSHE
jgi:type I restriction enzyme, S subunit